MDPDQEERFESMTPVEWYRYLIAEEEYFDMVECVYGAGKDGVKTLYEAILGDCEGPYVEVMAGNNVAIFAVSLDNEVHSLLELERFVALERPERLSEFPAMLKFMYDDKNVYAKDVSKWATSIDKAVRRGTPEEAARRVRELCEEVVQCICEQPSSWWSFRSRMAPASSRP